jgi:hypothetical protein
MDAASQLRASLLPVLQVWEHELGTEFAHVSIKIFDCSVGARTDWNGHNIGIECMFKEAAGNLPDLLALEISLKHVQKAPSIVSAEVVWGHPSGYIEASVLPASVAFSLENLAELIKRLPALFSALKLAVRRG